MERELQALLGTSDPPTNYALTAKDVAGIAACYDWDSRVDESNWSRGSMYETIAEMITASPGSFLADISRYYGDDYYLALDPDEPETREKWAREAVDEEKWASAALRYDEACYWYRRAGDVVNGTRCRQCSDIAFEFASEVRDSGIVARP